MLSYFLLLEFGIHYLSVFVKLSHFPLSLSSFSCPSCLEYLTSTRPDSSKDLALYKLFTYLLTYLATSAHIWLNGNLPWVCLQREPGWTKTESPKWIRKPACTCTLSYLLFHIYYHLPMSLTDFILDTATRFYRSIYGFTFMFYHCILIFTLHIKRWELLPLLTKASRVTWNKTVIKLWNNLFPLRRARFRGPRGPYICIICIYVLTEGLPPNCFNFISP